MQVRQLVVLSAVLLFGAIGGALVMGSRSEAQSAPAPSQLAVVWSSGDPEVAHCVCFMYVHAAKQAKWLVVWGPSARLLAGDKDLQAKVKSMIGDGVDVKACVVCADSYGVSDRLREMGIEVKAMGEPLTNLLKGDWKVLTF